MAEIPNNSSKNPVHPRFLDSWPSQNPPKMPKKRTIFDDIAATQKEAQKKAIEYKSKIKTGLPDEKAVEPFLFFFKFPEFDKDGRVRTKLLRQVDDVSLIAVFDFQGSMPIKLANLIAKRLQPYPNNQDGKKPSHN